MVKKHGQGAYKEILSILKILLILSNQYCLRGTSVGELREIVEMGTVERWFALLAVVGPVIGTIVGAAAGSRKGQPKRGAVGGLLVGLLGTLNWLLWRLYNVITDTNGLD